MEIKELEIDLNVEGWKISGGRSGNVWGQVSTENIPFEIIEQAVKKGKKSCIWTALDSVLYVEEKKKDFDKTDSYSRASHKDKEQAKKVFTNIWGEKIGNKVNNDIIKQNIIIYKS